MPPKAGNYDLFCELQQLKRLAVIEETQRMVNALIPLRLVYFSNYVFCLSCYWKTQTSFEIKAMYKSWQSKGI